MHLYLRMQVIIRDKKQVGKVIKWQTDEEDYPTLERERLQCLLVGINYIETHHWKITCYESMKNELALRSAKGPIVK